MVLLFLFRELPDCCDDAHHQEARTAESGRLSNCGSLKAVTLSTSVTSCRTWAARGWAPHVCLAPRCVKPQTSVNLTLLFGTCVCIVHLKETIHFHPLASMQRTCTCFLCGLQDTFNRAPQVEKRKWGGGR